MTAVYLVTGTNKGIGLEFVNQLSQKADVFVYATVRDTSKATELNKLATAKKNVQVVTYEGNNDGETLTTIIEKGYGRIDTVIANAGAGNVFGTVADTSLNDFRTLYDVNCVKTIYLYQSIHGLLLRSANPRFIAISSGLGSTGLVSSIPMPVAAYGVSKAALNHILVRIAVENKEKMMIAFPLHPGVVVTDMSRAYATNGMISQEKYESDAISAEESVRKILQIIANATMETAATFCSYDGSVLPW